LDSRFVVLLALIVAFDAENVLLGIATINAARVRLMNRFWLPIKRIEEVSRESYSSQ